MFKRFVAFAAAICWLTGVTACIVRIAEAGEIVVRNGLTGQIVSPVQVSVERNDMTVLAEGYLPRRVASSNREPMTVWPTDDADYEFNLVYGSRVDSYLARPRDGVYGISLPDALANNPTYRSHLHNVIAEVTRITEGHIILQQVPETVADVRLIVNPDDPNLYVLGAAALAYVYKDRSGYNSQGDLVFKWSSDLTDFYPDTLLHEVGHWLGFWHSKETDVMGPRPDGTRFRQFSPRLTATWRMMHLRLPTNQFPDDGRIIGFARPKSRDAGQIFVCQR